MKSDSRPFKIVIGSLVVLISLAALTGYLTCGGLGRWKKQEIITWGIIEDVHEFVRTHDGEWPKSWADIGDGTDRSEYTAVRFDLTAQDIIEDEPLIEHSIRPNGREWLYGVPSRRFQSLKETIVRMNPTALGRSNPKHEIRNKHE